MTLTEANFARAAAAEASQLRMSRLERMSYPELRALLTGDPPQAALWVRSAAEHGIPAAQLRLGRMLLEGRGIPRDECEAFAWFTRAARQGEAEALNMLGRCHENGWGVPADPAAAAGCYRAAADAGHDWGEYNLGNLLFDGRGVAPDPRAALYWYVRAACRGHARAMNLAARCLEEGWGCRRDCAEAAYWYRRSAQSGYFRGQFNYALLLLEERRVEEAAQWLWKAAVGGNAALRRAVATVLEGTTDPALAAVVAGVARLPPPQA
jgi:TPR repeat protein